MTNGIYMYVRFIFFFLLLQLKEHSQNLNWMRFVCNYRRMSGSIRTNQCLALDSMMWMLLWAHSSSKATKQFGLINASKYSWKIFGKKILCITDLSNGDRFRDPFCIDTSHILGFIMNVPSEYKFGFIVMPFRRRHWIAIRKVNKFYWNLDSKLNAPECIGDDAEVINYLSNQFKSNDMELFVIVNSETGQTKRWLKDDSREVN